MTGAGQDQDVIRVEDVTVQFGETVAIRKLSFSVKEGERVAILGSTGSGKSTLLNLLIGSRTPTFGSVMVTGLDPYAQHKQLQGRIGMAFQSPNLLPWFTSLDNARVGLNIMGHGKEQSKEVARKWLARVHLDGVEDLYPSQLSGGMRQRVSLARAFAIEPKVLMLDESFSALDEVTAWALRKDFRDLCQERGATALLVTHNIEEAFFLGTRVLVFGSPAQILAEYKTSDYAAPDAFRSVRDEIHKLMNPRNGTGQPPSRIPDLPEPRDQSSQQVPRWPS
jgi:NitT/TauT family transport system ATP-binding protein